MRTFIKILLPLLLLAQQLFAQDTILISDPAIKGYLGKQVYTFQDKEGQLLVADLIKAPQLFTKSDNAVINFGVSNYTNWVRFYLKNASDHDKLFLNISYPVIDSVCLYTLTATGVDSIRIRDNGSLNNRKYKHPFYIFELSIPKGTAITCFLELKSNKQIIVPIEVQNTEHIASTLTMSDSVSWLYFGIMLAMILYNLFVYFSSKDRHYLYYCNYIFWVLLTQFTLLGFLHRIPILDNVSFTPGILTFAGALSGIATVVFAKSFLYVKQNIPKYVLVLNCIILGDVLAIVMLLAGNPIVAYNIVNATAGIGSLIVLFVALKVYLKKYKPARYFLFGQVFFLGGVIIFVLKDVGVLPYTIFTIRAVQIGSVIEAMLLSFALADKLNILKKEKELSQANALMIAKENERIIREQNINLEIKVNERTLELKESNNELNRTLDDLKQAQTQLVESEKMASLGQLTAGIAHEINNPINFVTSNVTPLKRDVDMLFDVINTIEEVGMSALSPEEKHRKIEAYKEEQDYDYLKVEINHLLKGIYEGASRTAEIVKGLRIFSRVDEDDLKKADVNEGIDSTIVIINNMLNNRIEIIRNYGTLPLIECYPGKLNQVFLNIISNAIHAVGKHFGEQVGGEIIITTTTDGKDVFIRIKDNGIGMDDKTRSKIFEPFFTTKDVGEGTGLGMSIAYNTIKKHNGTIHVESQPGKGAEFIIRLPVIFEVPAIA